MLFYQRAKDKCIIFSYPQVLVKTEKEKIEVTVNATKKYMKVSIIKRAAITDPEKKIRDFRRLKRK